MTGRRNFSLFLSLWGSLIGGSLIAVGVLAPPGRAVMLFQQSGTQLYVDWDNGDNEFGTGSSQSPWKTITWAVKQATDFPQTYPLPVVIHIRPTAQPYNTVQVYPTSDGLPQLYGKNHNAATDPQLDVTFHLPSGSQVTDTGDDSAPGIPAVDIDNEDRIVDLAPPGDHDIDLGADERQTP